MAGNPTAYLYGPKGRIRGVAGVLVSTNVAAFNPWPVSLDYRKAFSVRIISADGSTDEWATPKEVVYMRLEGAKESTNVAGVTLDRHSDFPVVLGTRVPEDVIVEALEDKAKGSRGALLDLSADRFGGLANRSRRLPTVANPTLGDGKPPAAIPETFTVSTGQARLAKISICRIFRWD